MKKKFSILLVILLLVAFVTGPINVNAKAAETLADLRKELTALQKQKKDYDSQKKNSPRIFRARKSLY